MRENKRTLWFVLLSLAFLASPTGAREGFAFGSNAQLQLGTILNTTLNHVIALHPTTMSLFENVGVVNVSVGLSHALALSDSGTIYRWGGGSRGQLGGLSQAIPMPSMLVSLEGGSMWSKRSTQINCGFRHSLALVGNNQVWAWGDNTKRQLGVDLNDKVTFPHVTVSTNITNVTTPAPVLPKNGTLNRLTPITTTTGSPASASASASVGGRRNNGTLPLVPNVTVVKSVMCSTPNCTVLRVPRDHSSTPVLVRALLTTSSIVSILAAADRSAALTDNGEVWVWGDNSDGLIGVDSNDDFILPTMVDNLPPIVQLQMGIDFFVAVDVNNKVWVWGDNSHNQLGLGEGSPDSVESPVELTFFDSIHVSRIFSGWQHTLVVDDKGRRVYSFGNNEFGQLGLNDFDGHKCPDQIDILKGYRVVGVSPGRSHNVLLTQSGAVLGWGLNNQGQLGMGDTTNRPLPTRILTIEGKALRRVAAGHATTFAWTGPDAPLPQPNTFTKVTSNVPKIKTSADVE